jgi:hypothetical protein
MKNITYQQRVESICRRTAVPWNNPAWKRQGDTTKTQCYRGTANTAQCSMDTDTTDMCSLWHAVSSSNKPYIYVYVDCCEWIETLPSVRPYVAPTYCTSVLISLKNKRHNKRGNSFSTADNASCVPLVTAFVGPLKNHPFPTDLDIAVLDGDVSNDNYFFKIDTHIGINAAHLPMLACQISSFVYSMYNFPCCFVIFNDLNEKILMIFTLVVLKPPPSRGSTLFRSLSQTQASNVRSREST